MMNNEKELVLVTGVSGAGKSTAMNILEDMGYTCIDRYPSELLANLLTLIREDYADKYKKIALSMPLYNYDKYRILLNNTGIKTVLILLDAEEETIIKRYKFTRRVHPLLISKRVNTLAEAIKMEKNILTKYLNDTPFLLDTTNMNSKTQRFALAEILHHNLDDNFTISFISFGFKNGLPADADLVFDVRVLDNPFYIPNLKPLTGNDEEVYNFVLDNSKAQIYLQALIDYLDEVIMLYAKQDKRHLSVCVGCTGGQHRSVAVVNFLYNNYHTKFLCYKKHREVSE